MLHKTFELIPIKIGFFYDFLKLLKNWANVPVLYSTGILTKNEKERILHFIIFFDAYTCTYVA